MIVNNHSWRCVACLSCMPHQMSQWSCEIVHPTDHVTWARGGSFGNKNLDLLDPFFSRSLPCTYEFFGSKLRKYFLVVNFGRKLKFFVETKRFSSLEKLSPFWTPYLWNCAVKVHWEELTSRTGANQQFLNRTGHESLPLLPVHGDSHSTEAEN